MGKKNGSKRHCWVCPVQSQLDLTSLKASWGCTEAETIRLALRVATRLNQRSDGLGGDRSEMEKAAAVLGGGEKK